MPKSFDNKKLINKVSLSKITAKIIITITVRTMPEL